MMFKRILCISIFIILAFMCRTTATAQANDFLSWLMQTEQHWEKNVQQSVRDFRLMRHVQTYPERINATKTFHIETEPEGAVITLHDELRGTPLESCLSPCDLQINANLQYVIVAYRFGFTPQPAFIGPLDSKTKLWLGTNFLEVVQKQAACWSEFQASPKVDADAEVCVRMPPIMSPVATKSGHCRMMFDISEKGRPINIEAKFCTEDHFAEPSIVAVNWWYYTPKVERGQAVTQMGVETQMTFRLSDEDGNLLPE